MNRTGIARAGRAAQLLLSMENEGKTRDPAGHEGGNDGGQRGCVAVTGATGFVGGHIVRRLVDEGYSVRALVRSTARARDRFPTALLNSKAITLSGGSLSDPDALNALVRGCVACIHLVGIIRQGRGQRFETVHVDGVRSLVNACKDHNPAMRLVHMSALGVGPDPRGGYRDTKHRGAQVVRTSSLKWTIVRPGLIHGPDGEFTRMCVDWARGRRVPYLFMPYFSRWKRGGFGFEAPSVAPVFVEDVARVFVEALDRPSTIGRAYDLTGSQTLLFPEMLRAYSDKAPGGGWKRATIGIPWRLAAFKARLAGALGLGGLLPFDEGMAFMGGRDSVSDNAPIERDFGFLPAGFESSLSQYADQL